MSGAALSGSGSGPVSAALDQPRDTPRRGAGLLRYIDWIWHIRGTVPLAPGQSGDEAFDRLLPLLRTTGTRHERGDGVLTFWKKDAAAQDKLSIFDHGVLRIDEGRSLLRYHLTSRALLACFLAPLLFLGMAYLTIVASSLATPPTAAEKAKAEAKARVAQEKAAARMHPLDKALGAPAPDKPKKDKAKKAEDDDDGPSPIPGYVFAAMFAALYVVGRWLEDRLVKRLFARHLSARPDAP